MATASSLLPAWERRVLRAMTDAWPPYFLVVDMERVQRIIETPPELVGQRWMQAALGTGEHLAQLYHAFRRHDGARAVRPFARYVLSRSVPWENPCVGRSR